MLNFRQEDTRGTQVGLTGLTWTALAQAVKSILYPVLEEWRCDLSCPQGKSEAALQRESFSHCPTLGSCCFISQMLFPHHPDPPWQPPNCWALAAASKTQKSLLQPLLLEAEREVLGGSCCTGCQAVWTRGLLVGPMGDPTQKHWS